MSNRNAMQHVWHHLVGARGATNIFSNQVSTTSPTNGTRTPNFGKVYTNPSEEIAKHRLVFFGEIHSMPPIVSFQREVQEKMREQCWVSSSDSDATSGNPQLHVVLEHFSFDFQDLLDQYSKGELTFDQLVNKYKEQSEEGHRLEPYRELLEDAKATNVHLHAGFLPRKYARMLVKRGPEETLQAASEWISPNADLKGSDFHYNVFESLISGRSIYQNDAANPTDQFRQIFPAQVLKDVAMANKINELLAQTNNTNSSNRTKNDKILVIAGNGHLMHFCGVPERVLKENPEIASDACLVISESTVELFEDDDSVAKLLTARFGEEGSNPADYIYFYPSPEEDRNDEDEGEYIAKQQTRTAYDKVGESASLPGNQMKAAWIMHNLRYSEKQFQIAGPDAYNFQGVGNPHLHAKITPGDQVLDVGSGLGVDSFIASHSAGGPQGGGGQVIGIDLSSKEVKHAQFRAKDRQLENVQFMVADMENIPLPDNSIDVVISNGAFCLAPNKERAFSELFRVLRPGGRISVCTTTIKSDNLEPGVSWPLCMKMFIAQKELTPMCEALGYVDVFVDDRDNSMTMNIPEEVLKYSNPNRNKVHVGGDDFQHLENYDMDKICARVCVVARKPLE